SEEEPARQPAILDQPFELTADIEGSVTGWQLGDLTLELGDMLAKGQAAVDLTAAPKMDVELALNRFDFDRFLQPRPETSSDSDSDSESDSDNGSQTPAELPFALPMGVTAQLDLSVEALTYRGSLVSKVRLLGGLENGALTVNRLSALLPGGSDA